MTSNPMVSVVELAGQYKSEFENSFNELMKYATTFTNSTDKMGTFNQFNVFHHELLKQRDEMMIKIKDIQSNLSDLDTTKLMKAFSWMAIMLLDATLLAYFILPLTVYYFLQLPLEITETNDLFRRHMLFSFAIFEGLLIGYLFSDKNLIGIPPIAALTPIAIGLIPHFGSTIIGEDHAKLICLTIGGGFILHLSMGIIIDLSLPYLLLATLYGIIGFAILQLYVNNTGKDFTITHIYQLAFIYAVIISQALIYIIFGFDTKEMADTTSHSSFSFF
uniref:t-SNARE coiled-coil homology domain-containing protein n=1 Tax=Loa loa TaxID=7209 RepID=A0A1I7W3C9_LOALO